MESSGRALVDSWLSARLRMSGVPTDALQAVPLVEIAHAVRDNVEIDLDQPRLVAEHPGCRDVDQVLRALDVLGEKAYRLTATLIATLGRLGDVAAVPALSRYLRSNDYRYHEGATAALLALNNPSAREALVGILDDKIISSKDDPRLTRAVDAAFQIRPEAAFDVLGTYLEEPIASTPLGQYVATVALRRKPSVLQKDPRWLDLAVTKLSDPRLNTRDVLLKYPPAEVAAARERLGVFAPPPRPTPAVPKRVQWISRYREGECAAVWDEIAALGDSIRHPSVLPEAEAVVREMMLRLRRNLERIISILDERGYAFFEGKASKVLVAPSAKTESGLQEMQRVLGRPLPLSVRGFYETIGKVNLMEAEAPTYEDEQTFFEEFGRNDPFMVVSTGDAIKPLKASAKHEAKYPPEYRRPLDGAYLAPAPERKSTREEMDEGWYELRVDRSFADGTVFRLGNEVPFVTYLRKCVLSGGGFCEFAGGWPEYLHEQRNVLLAAIEPF